MAAPPSQQPRHAGTERVDGPGDIAMVVGEEVVGDRLRDLAEPGVADLLATIFPVDDSEMWVTRPGVFSEPGGRGLDPGRVT